MDKELEMKSPLVHGLNATSAQPRLGIQKHPLELSEETYWQRKEQSEFAMLRSVYGISAPLKLKCERKIVAKNGHLPFLKRSNASLDVLTGRDEIISVEDYLGHPHEPEQMGQPHAMVENFKL